MANALDIATKPGWALKVLMGKRHSFGNLQERVPGADSLTTLSQWIAGQFDPSLSWQDVEWVRSLWPGKLILKGMLDVEDAKIAAASGADAIVVSNHGGRQLDGARSTISALPRVVEAVGDKTEVLFDSGVQSGQDILKALAHGRQGLPDGQGLPLRPRRRRRGRRDQGDRDHRQGARRLDGAHRHEAMCGRWIRSVLGY